MGTWEYEDRDLGPDLPAVKNSFNRFNELLTSPLCGWPTASVIPVTNELHPGRVPDLLMTQFAAATDVALFYYVGHGLLSDDEEVQLCLALSGTVKDPHRTVPTSLLYSAVRRALLRSPARTKIVILDCCNSSIALPPRLAQSDAAAAEAVPEELLDETGVERTCVWVAAARKYAYYEADPSTELPQTYFTKHLVDLIERGIDDGPPELTMKTLFRRLDVSLREGGHSRPAARGDSGGDYPFCRNAVLMPQPWHVLRMPGKQSATVGEALRDLSPRGRFIIARSPHSPTAPEITDATRLTPDERMPVPGAARRTRRWLPVALAACAVAAVMAAGLTVLLGPGAGTVAPPQAKTSTPAPPQVGISTSGTDVSGVRFTGNPGNYTVTINGTGFGSPAVSLPYYGFLPNFRISDDEQARHGEWGYTGDSVPVAYQSWSDSKIVIAGIGASQGDALDVAVWNNTTRAGASWGGNAPPVPASAPVIRSVSVSGAASNPAVTIKGSGFGPAPVAMPFTGQLGNLVISDWRTDPNGVDPPDTWTTGVTERFTSWADNEIQISGFAGTFGHGPNVLHPGDPLTIRISSTQGKSLGGAQTAWGGRPTASPANPPLAVAKTAYVVNSASGTVTPISTVTGQAGAAIPVGPNPGAIAITPDGKTVYVAPAVFSPSSALVPISTATNKAGPAIPLSGDSFMIAITPDGKTVYVASSSYGTVTPVSTATGKASPPIPTGVVISAIAITPDSKTVYVTGVTGADPLGKVIPIPTATNRPSPAIPVGKNPAAIVITPNGSTAYVLNTGSRSVTPISTATNKPGLPIPAGADPAALAITPDGKTAYVVNETTLGTVTPVSLATNTPGPAITVGDHPDAIVITPDGKTAWVANVFSSTLTPVSTAINTAGPPIYIASGTHDIAVTPDGKTVYVTNGAGPSGAVTPVNTLTHQAGPAIKVGDQPTSIAITPY